MRKDAMAIESTSCSEDKVPIPHGPDGLFVHLDKLARRLTTPWQVCLIRARQLAECELPEGNLIDPACGAGLQLAALANILGKSALGVEIDESRAKMAAANQSLISEFLGNELRTVIVAGDGTDSESVLSASNIQGGMSLFYFDPARPEGSTTHDPSEMRPLLDQVLDAWKPHLNEGANGPALVLDLSPRLSTSRRLEVEAIIEERWPEIAKTWQWASRGSGRIDRLSLWLGAAANPISSRRFVRIPADIHSNPLIIEADESRCSLPDVNRTFPRKGDRLTIVDSALVASGLANVWLEQVLSQEDQAHWQVQQGRRPIITHSMPLQLQQGLDSDLIQCSGEIVSLLRSQIDEDHIELISKQAEEVGFGSLTLRLSLPPEKHPVMQRELNRRLARGSGNKTGFIARTGEDDHLLLCLENE